MRKLATVRIVDEVIEIPKADKICQIRIGGWYLIAKKNEFVVGDKCVYFEIDTILPSVPVFEFMRPRKYRVKTIKCMKLVSQGLALPMSILKEFTRKDPASFKVGDVLDEIIDVIKHDPEAAMEARQNANRPPRPWWKKLLARIPFFRKFLRNSSRLPFPNWLITKTDEERVQNLSKDQMQVFLENTVHATEKLDGCSATYAYRPNKIFGSEFVVCSRNFHLVKKDTSWWWECARVESIELRLKLKHKELVLHPNEWLIVQGEILGPAIQKNKYKLHQKVLKA